MLVHLTRETSDTRTTRDIETREQHLLLLLLLASGARRREAKVLGFAGARSSEEFEGLQGGFGEEDFADCLADAAILD